MALENLRIVPAYDRPQEVRELFDEYMDMLIQGDPTFAEYLELQHYDEELENLRGKYGMPEGRLYLAYVDGALAGSIGLLKMDEDKCELKRLYVKPEFRGAHLGRTLAEKIISDARQIGYKHIYLDTLPFLKNALYLYKSLGFYEIPKYNDSPMAESYFLRLDL